MDRTNVWTELFSKSTGLNIEVEHVTIEGCVEVELADTEFIKTGINHFYGHDVDVKMAVVAKSKEHVERLYVFVENEIITLAMFVEEHNAHASPPVARRAYIQYVEKNNYFPRYDPKPACTLFTAALVSYLRYAHQVRCLIAVHLWADPPAPNCSYLFYGTSVKVDPEKLEPMQLEEERKKLRAKYFDVGKIAEFKVDSFKYTVFTPPLPRFNSRKVKRDPDEKDPLHEYEDRRVELIKEIEELLKPIDEKFKNCLVYDLSCKRLTTVVLSHSRRGEDRQLLEIGCSKQTSDVVKFDRRDMNREVYSFATEAQAKKSSREILEEYFREKRNRKRVRYEFPDYC